jgi:alkaline phosphatase D
MASFPDPFRHGVASGDPHPDRVILWTRVTLVDELEPDVAWVVARDPELGDVVASGIVTTSESVDFTVKVDAAGLDEGTTYFYAFTCAGIRSPIGRTKTAAAGSVDRLRLALVSCAKYTAGYFNVYARIAERDDLDFLLHVGDYIYEYGNVDPKANGPAIGRPVDPEHECWTLDHYRRRYAHYRLDPDLQLVHERHPIVATLDDHEIADNTWRGGAKLHDPARHGEWETRKAAALRAWREWMPVRLPPPPDEHRIYRALRFGDLADLFMLDGRTKRDAPTKRTQDMDAPDRSILGEEEEGWFMKGLERSEATWRLVGNDVMIGQVFTGFLPDELGEPLSEVGILTKRERGPEPDQWDGYTAERDRLFSLLEERQIANVVFLSGDVHTAWAVELKRRPQDSEERPAAVELVTASVTTENLDEHLGATPRTDSLPIERQVADENPHVRWVDLDSHGYVLVDLTPERLEAEWWFVETTQRRDDGQHQAAAWRVEAGEPRLVPIGSGA